MSDIVDTSPLGIERTERIAGDDALNSRLDTVTTELQGTQESVTTEVLHRSEGDLVIQRILEGYIQDLLEGKAEDFERYIEFQNSQNLNYADVRNFVSGIRTSLADDIRDLSTSLMNNLQANDARYDKLVSDVGRYLEILSDITLDSKQITLDNGELRAGAWTILSQARAWDLEIINRLNGLSESVGDSLKDAVEEIQNQLPSTEETITKAIEELSKSPLIKELSDLLNQSIENDIAYELALLEQARKHANEMSQLAEDMRAEALAKAQAMEDYMAGEVTARITEVNKEVAARKEAIDLLTEDMLTRVDQDKADYQADMLATANRIKSAEDGLTSEIQHRKDGDTSTLNALNTYKVSNDTAFTGLSTSLSNNVTKTNANTTLITGLTSRMTTAEEGIGNATTAAADAMSKATTAVTANSALATRVDALAASITESEGTVVDVNAFNALKAEVNTVKGTVTGLVEDVTALETNYTSVNNKVSSQGTAISTLNTKMSTAENSLSQSANDITLLKTDISKVNAGLLTKVDSQAFSQLSSDVTELDDKYTTQASLVTDLRGSLDTTNVNVGNATTAAQNALTAAGSKGKVIFGTSAPATADRLSQNLWIDTTGGANTPKRWNGSAWVVVTDKVATDALAAANAATILINTKADTSAFNSLDQKVTVMDGKVSTNTNSITSLSGKIDIVEGGLATKLDSSAIVNYYTKQQADDKALSTAAGEISKYDASLVIGGVNQLADSEAARTSGAASNREYLKYESSEHLKQFYDDNLGKDITISFEVLVPVAGGVQVYSSNGSAHLYTLSTPWIAADTWTKVSVTGKPREHTTTPNSPVSTLEFYGVYGTGRIPTVRKVQLEAGNKATAWAPSPRDTQASLDANATAIQNTNAEVGLVDGKTTVNANAITGLTSRLGNVEGQVTTKADASALQDYYTKTEAAANATTVAAGEVAKYDANLVIGGSNLQDNADFKTTSLNRWAGIYGAVTSIEGGIQYKGTSVSGAARIEKTLTGLEVGQTYTLSVWAKSPVPLEFRGLVDATAVKNIMPESHDPSVFQRYTCTFIPHKATGALLRAYVPNIALTALLIMNKEKLEIGSKGTDWSPSSSDIQTSLDANATAIENTNAEVRKVDGRVTTESNRITTLSGRVSTVEGGLALKADTTALNNIYTKTESDAKATSLAAGEVNKFSTSLKVGTRNYISKGYMDGSAFTGYAGATLQVTPNQNKSEMPVTNPTNNPFKLKITGGTNILLTTPTMSMRKGIKATLSFKIKNVGANDAVLNFNGFAPYTYEKGAVAISPNSEVEVVVFGQMRTDYDWIQFQFRNPTGSANGSYTDVTVLLADIMFSEGHMHTGWTEPMAVVMGELDANAEAISTTTSEVERVDGVVKGHTTQLSNLTASIAGKASSAALDSLTVRVEAEEGRSSTQASSITNLTSKADDLLDVVTIKDTRSTNQPPSWYLTNYARRTVNEFKTQTAIGVGGFFGGTYCNLETKVYYTDLSGGHLIQTATSATDPSSYVQRVSTSTAAWGAWAQPIKDLRDGLAEKASASALSTLSTKVDDVDGIVTTQANQLIVLTSDNNANKNALTVQGKVIDGVKSSYMVKMETNGVIGGFGLMQSTGVLGQVQTSFGVNANSFFIGAPSSKKQPFIVTTTNQVVNGVTYPAGTYIDVALIANATIGTAHIANASITNAKIDNIDAAKITTGTLDAGRIRVGSSTQFDSGFAPTDVFNDAKSYVDSNTGNLVNNPSVSGTKARWSSGTITNQDFLGTEIPVLALTSSGDLMTICNDIDIDPAKAYEVSVWFKKSAAVGSSYLGLYPRNATGSIIQINSVNQSGGTSLTSNFYHWSVSGAANPVDWIKLVAYIMPAGTDPLDMKQVGNVTSNAFMLPNTRKMQMRLLNYYNGGTSTTLWIANPKIVEVDPNAVIAASKAQILADSKTQTFTAQPTTPYARGDIYRNGSSIYVCTSARTSGSYVASDWTLVGDVTANNTAADANKLGGTAAATVLDNAAKGIAVYNDVMSDLKITPVEKTAINQEWGRIQKEYASLVAQATSLSVSTATLTAAYNGLSTTAPAMSTILASMSTTTTLTAAQRDAYKVQYTTYYTQSADMVKVINEKIASNAKADLDNLEIGSRNLLKDSALIHFKGSDSGGNGGASVVVGDFVRLTPVAAGNVWGNSAANGGLVTASELIAGEQYTYSVMVKTAMTSIGLYCYSGGNHIKSSIPLKSGNVWERVSFTFTQTTARAKNFTFLAGFHQLETGVVVEYRNFKLEKGNKATDWTPAPEDVDTAIESKSKTFTSQPTTPYSTGDMWRNGSTIYVCTTARSSGAYTASDWTLVGDVTANNTSADTAKVNGVSAATVATNAANGATVYADVMSDLKITPVEKTAINQEWNRIQKEYASLLAQAQALSITTTTYAAAYTGLSTTAPAMSTILASMNTTTTLTAAQRDAYKTQYTTYYTQAVAITKAINDKIAANAKAQADAKSKTFTTQPVTPYTAGDLWKDGTTIKVCTVSRVSGSYVASDWTLVGDVTSANTAANANQLGGKASATVLNDIATAASTATTAKGTADAASNQLTLWKYPNTTYIDGGKIYANSVTANQINVTNLSSLSSNLGTIKVDTANIADGAITTAKIENLQVDTLKIKDRAVTVPYFYVDTAPVSINNQRFDSFPKDANTNNWVIPTISGLTLGGFSANADVLVMCDVKLTASMVASQGRYDSAEQVIQDMTNGLRRTTAASRVTARLLAGYYDTGLGGETGDAQIIGVESHDTRSMDYDGMGISGTRLELGGTYTRRLKADSSGRIAISLWVSSYGTTSSVHRLTVTPRGSIVWYVQELKK